MPIPSKPAIGGGEIAPVRDRPQVVQAAQVERQRGADHGVLPGDLAVSRKFLHGTHSRGSAFYNATLYAGLVQRTSFEDVTCSVAQCLDVVGEWWSLLIVRDAFLGVTRFDDFQARLGISRNILTQRLNHLVEAGILKRVPYQDHPPRC